MRFPTKIPTIVGLLLVVTIIAGMIFASERLIRSPTVASGSIKPADVQISNITESGFTVTWTTGSPATGAIEVKPDGGKKNVVFDERDTMNKKQNKYITHSVSTRNLTGSTTYEVAIFSNGKAYRDNGKPYQVTTAPSLPPSTDGLEPAFGTVLTADNKPADGALVYLTVEGGQILSTLVKPSGSWVIPLNFTRTSDLSQLLPKAERMTESIVVRSDGQQASATTDTLNDSPVPEMILGKTYDFRKQQAIQAQPSSPIALITPTPSVLGETTTPASLKVSLTTPAQGASLTTTLPLIQGTGFPGKFVAITLGITNPVSGSTTVGADGLWRFTPAEPLAPGKQSVTATTQDDKGKDIALTHTFEILKSGTQVLGDATPSATLAPTFTPTPASTLAGEPVPTSGSIVPTLLLLILGAMLLTGGTLAFVF